LKSAADLENIEHQHTSSSPASDAIPQGPDSRIIAFFQPPKLSFYSLQAITERLERARYLAILGIRFKLERDSPLPFQKG
jgi:hypothetical protein